MKEYASKVAQKGFGTVLKELKNGAVKVTKNGKPFAVILSVADYQKLVLLNEEAWEREATVAQEEGFVGGAEMVVWISKKLEVPKQLVEKKVYRRREEKDRIECTEIAESIIKMSIQVKNFANKMSKIQFLKFFSEVAKLLDSKNECVGGFQQHDFGKYRMMYNHTDEHLQLIYMSRR